MFHFEIQHFLILTFKIPIIKNAGNPYNKRFPDKKLTPFGLGGSNGVRLIMLKVDQRVRILDLFFFFLKFSFFIL